MQLKHQPNKARKFHSTPPRDHRIKKFNEPHPSDHHDIQETNAPRYLLHSIIIRNCACRRGKKTSILCSAANESLKKLAGDRLWVQYAFSWDHTHVYEPSAGSKSCLVGRIWTTLPSWAISAWPLHRCPPPGLMFIFKGSTAHLHRGIYQPRRHDGVKIVFFKTVSKKPFSATRILKQLLLPNFSHISSKWPPLKEQRRHPPRYAQKWN